MKVIAITQARLGSTRLPGKVLKKVGEQTLLGLHLERLQKAKSLNKVIVATTNESDSHKICEIADEQGAGCFKGSLDDVLDRFYRAVVDAKPDYVVRVTSDCPLIDPELIDEVVNSAIDGSYDYYANIITEDFPDGQDVEVMTFKALEQAWNGASKSSEREHVTPFIRNNSTALGGRMFRSADHKCSSNYNQVRMTVDEQVDLDTIKWLISKLGTDKDWKSYADYMLNHQSELQNVGIKRNEGYQKSLEKDNRN